MNELYTPPGFVEYPRDKKFRPQDDIDRLELMSKGYATLLWAPLFATPLYQVTHSRIAYDWWLLGFDFVLLVCLVLTLNSGLSRIFRAKGASERLAFCASLIPAVVYILRIARLFPDGLLLCAFITSLIVIACIAHRTLKDQYGKFDLKIPKALTSATIKKVVGELRERETLASAGLLDRGEPSLADRLLDHTKVIRR